MILGSSWPREVDRECCALAVVAPSTPPIGFGWEGKRWLGQSTALDVGVFRGDLLRLVCSIIIPSLFPYCHYYRLAS
jgi:hypothetical protein